MIKQDRISELAEQILLHKRAYYSGKPRVTDAVYDALEDELRILSPAHPALSIVGDVVTGSDSRRVEHSEPMLSLAKTYDEQELLRWVDGHSVMGTIKVDGNSLSVVYKNGELQLAKTRGNGRVGEDVSDKVRWIAAIPATLSGLSQIEKPGEIEVRGEVYCTETNFVKLSDEMGRIGLERPTSPRNIVAGLLGRKSHIDLARYFGFFAFDVVQPTKYGIKTELEKFAWLEKRGFALPFHQIVQSSGDVQKYLLHVKDLMEDGELGIDGAVFTYNDLNLHSELGLTAHHPRYKMSFKWQGQTAVAAIREIVWQTSRLGVITPVAVIEPVYLSGAQISNITLHNASHVRAYNLKAGDRIELVRSGEVIPKFLSVVESASGEYVWPKKCGECGSLLIADDVRLRCQNTLSCPAQRAGAILNWIKCAEIDDLSEKRLAPLMDEGLVKTVADLYRLTKDQLLVIPQTKDKMATKLHGNIQKSRRLPLARFLNGLGIQGTGLTTWELILRHFRGLDSVRRLSVEDLISIDGFAQKSSEQIVSGLKEKSALIDDLLAVGVDPLVPEVSEIDEAIEGNLAGKLLVITGTLSRPRPELEKIIKAAGGKLGTAVSGNTFALVTADPTGNSSKLKKARELGVRLWGESDLVSAIENGVE